MHAPRVSKSPASTLLATNPEGAGLAAAAFMALAPGNISRSIAGSFDNEGVAICVMMFTFTLWMRAVRTVRRTCYCVCSYRYVREPLPGSTCCGPIRDVLVPNTNFYFTLTLEFVGVVFVPAIIFP